MKDFIDPVVQAAKRHEMYVILDDHGYFSEKIDEAKPQQKAGEVVAMGRRRLCDLDETARMRRLSYPAIGRRPDRIDWPRTVGDSVRNQTAALL